MRALVDHLAAAAAAAAASLPAVPGVTLSAMGAGCTLGSYYYLQPLGDTLALSMGVEYTPLVTLGNMALIILVNPLYAAAALNLPTASILPFLYRVVIAVLLVFAVLFYYFSGVKALSFCFSVYAASGPLPTSPAFDGLRRPSTASSPRAAPRGPWLAVARAP